MAFTHLLSPMKVGNKVYKNRIVSAPMAFALVAQNPMAAEVSYRKLEGPAKGGNACVILGETDVNFRDAVRIPGFKPFDFAKPEEDMQTVSKSMTVSHWLSWFTAEKKKFRSTISRKQSDRWPVQTLPEFRFVQ